MVPIPYVPARMSGHHHHYYSTFISGFPIRILAAGTLCAIYFSFGREDSFLEREREREREQERDMAFPSRYRDVPISCRAEVAYIVHTFSISVLYVPGTYVVLCTTCSNIRRVGTTRSLGRESIRKVRVYLLVHKDLSRKLRVTRLLHLVKILDGQRGGNSV